MKQHISRRSVLKLAAGGSGAFGFFNFRESIAGPLSDQWDREKRGKKPEVKVTGTEMIRVEVPWKSAVEGGRVYNEFAVAKVITDAGVTGYAFGRDRIYNVRPWPTGDAVPEPYIKRLGLGERYTADELEDIKSILVGNNPFSVERFLQKGLGQYAAFEHALWDVIGKLTNTSVHHLLGGARERLKVYITLIWPGRPDQSDIPYERQAEDLLQYKKKGIKAAKIRCSRPDPMKDVEALKVIKKVCGDDFDIRFDKTAQYTSHPWDYDTALKTALAMQEHGAGWLEEVLHTDDFDGQAKLCEAVDVLITGGEHYGGLAPFARALAKNVYDIIQPDSYLAGGIFPVRKIGTIAEGFGKPCILHGANSLSLAGLLQTSASMPNCEWQEIAIVTPPQMPQDMWGPGLKLLNTKEMYTIRDGYIDIPQGPGLGLDVNEDALEEYRIG